VTPTPEVTVERADARLIARPQGRVLDEPAVRSVTRAVEEASPADDGIRAVVIDMSGVEVLPSFAVGLLVQLSDRCHARRRELVFAALQPQLRRMFAATRLDRVFRVLPSVDATELP
jgi:anti-anti-sigma factor